MKLIRKFNYNAPVILTFSLICVIVYLVSYLTMGWSNNNLFSVYSSSLVNPLFYVRIWGHVLGHASLSHLFNNVLIILLTGPILEEKYGSKAMLHMIVFTALITGVMHILLFKNVALLGASGIAFMLILLSSFANYEKGKIPLTLIFCVVFYIGDEVVKGLTRVDNISYLTHIIGGFCGAIFGFVLNSSKYKNRA